MAYSKSRGKAQAKWEKKAYFRTTVRFPADAERLIREKSNDNLNGYINRLVLKDCGYFDDAIEEMTNEKFEELP